VRIIGLVLHDMKIDKEANLKRQAKNQLLIWTAHAHNSRIAIQRSNGGDSENRIQQYQKCTAHCRAAWHND